jgi:hypothetical protein
MLLAAFVRLLAKWNQLYRPTFIKACSKSTFRPLSFAYYVTASDEQIVNGS